MLRLRRPRPLFPVEDRSGENLSHHRFNCSHKSLSWRLRRHRPRRENERGYGAIVSLRQRLRETLTSDLFSHGYVLVANQILSSGLGLLYWAVAARLLLPAEIGLASSTISGIVLLGMIAELGITVALTRYTAQVGQSFRRFAATCYALNIAAGILVWSVMTATGLMNFMIPELSGNHLPVLGAIICATLFYVQDGVLAARRRTWLILAKNLSYNLAKLALLVALTQLGMGHAVVLSWFAPLPFFSVAIGLIVFSRRLHARAIETHDRESTANYRQVVSVVGLDYLGGLLNEAATRLLPLIVLNRLGAAEAAFFFQGWLIANTISLASTSFVTSFVVTVAAAPDKLLSYARRSLGLLVLLVAVAVAMLILVAPLLLALLGKAYVENSITILRLLAVSSIPAAVNIWFIAFARLRNWGRSITINYATQGMLTIAGTLLLAPWLGLAGVGLACILGQIGAMLQTLSAVALVLAKPAEPAHDPAPQLREADGS